MPDAREILPTATVADARLPTPQISLPGYSTPTLQAQTFQPATKDPSAIRHIELSDRGARQMIGVGQELGDTANNLNRMAMAMQVKVNATVVDDALNDAREAARKLTWGVSDGKGGMVGGYKNTKGFDAINRPSGKALDDEVASDFDAQVKDIAKAKIKSPAQREAFGMQVNDIASQLRQGASSHQAEQFDTYHTGVYKGMVSNLTQDFALRDPTDLGGQRKAMGQIDGAVATLAAHEGVSAQELDVAQRSARGTAVASMFDAVMADKKYSTAQAILNEWGGQIDAGTATKMKLSLDGRVATQTGEQIGEDAWKHWAAPAYQATDPDRAFNVVLTTEHRGTPRQVDDNGKLIKSGKGAYGIAQITEDTAKAVAKQMHRPELVELSKQPTKEGEAANRLIGKVYFSALVNRFKGDIPKAIAAYNAGPGWLVGGRDTTGAPIEGALNVASRTGTDWRAHLPKETQDYLTYAMKSFGAGEGQPRKPTRQELLNVVDQRSDDPDVRRAAYTYLDRRFSAAEADEREGYESSYAEGLRIVRETGGNLNAIPPELKAKIKPEQFSTIQTYGKNITDGQYISTKPEAYYTAMKAAQNPKTTINQIEAMRPDLGEQDFDTVRRTFLERQAPQPGKGPDSLDVSTLDSIVDTRLEYLGVSTKPDKKDPAGMARLGAIRQFTHQYVLDMQRQTGQKFTDYKQLQDTVNQLFTRNQAFKNTFMGMTTGRGAQNVLTTTVKDIPADTRQKVTTTLQKALGRKPTDAETLQAYFRSQFYNGA